MNPAVSSLAYSPQQVIAEAFNFDPAELFNEESQGQIQLNGALLHLQIYRQEEANVLLLMADLGALPAQHRAEHYQLMLVANSGWRDLAGGALCTDDSGDHALLRLRLDLSTLGPETLVQWITAFVVAAEDWAERIAAPVSPTDANDSATAAGFTPPSPEFHGFLPFNRA